jgi:hypothetical protein
MDTDMHTYTLILFHEAIAAMRKLNTSSSSSLPFFLSHRALAFQAMDMIDATSVPLENFIHRGKAVFVQERHPQTGVPFPMMVIEMVTKLVQADGQTEIDSKKAFFLLMSMLHNCKGMIDPFLPSIVQLTLSRLTPSPLSPVIHTDRLKATLLMVMASAFNYNPLLTLQIMEHAATGQSADIVDNCTAVVFKVWFEMLTPVLQEAAEQPEEDDTEGAFTPFESMLSKKLAILGLTALLHVPFEQLPGCVKENLSQMTNAILLLVERLHEQKQNTENDEEDDGEDADIEDVELDPEMQEFDDEDGEVDNEEDLAYVENLRKLQNQKYADLENMYDDEEDEDQIFTSEIDDVDEVIWLSDTLNMVMSHPAGSGSDFLLI